MTEAGRGWGGGGGGGEGSLLGGGKKLADIHWECQRGVL